MARVSEGLPFRALPRGDASKRTGKALISAAELNGAMVARTRPWPFRS